MYDILQPNILSRKVPLLSNAFTNKKKKRVCIVHLLKRRKTLHATWGKEETSQIKKEIIRLLVILSIETQANTAIRYESVLWSNENPLLTSRRMK